jgi:hypothetical protein
MVAFAVLLLVQTPPPSVLTRVVVSPTHAVVLPVMAATAPFTVTSLVVKQAGLVRSVILVVPALTPVATPVDQLIVALAVVLLAHVPPEVALVMAMVLPTHTMSSPPMAGSAGATVTVVVRTQPLLV